MPIGEDLVKVQAMSLLPDLVDVYNKEGAGYNATYNPSAVGEWGWMWRTEAVAAGPAGTGDVLLHEEETPLSLQLKIPRPVSASVNAGVGKDIGIVHVAPGTYEGGNTLTLTVAIDGGGDLTASYDVQAGDTADDVATALAAELIAGCTLTKDTDADVIVTIDGAGLFTKFEVAVAATP